MTDSLHQQLLGHLLGALDDDEQEWLDERLEHDETCRLALSEWRRRLSPLAALRPDFDPPLGLAGRTCRLVAAYGPAPARSASPAMGMSPDPTAPVAVSGTSWHDMVALGVLFLTAVALLFPAIDISRFHSTLISCQNNMRQFGVAMNQYGQHQCEAVTQLADEGRLTAAGIAAADLLDDADDAVGEQNLCPEAWLAAQDTGGNWPAADDNGLVYPVSSSGTVDFSTADNWSGTWRDGTEGGCGGYLPDTQALFADDPSVALPGRRIFGHRGRGRNLFFRDGRIRFVPCSVADADSGTRTSTHRRRAPRPMATSSRRPPLGFRPRSSSSTGRGIDTPPLIGAFAGPYLLTKCPWGW